MGAAAFPSLNLLVRAILTTRRRHRRLALSHSLNRRARGLRVGFGRAGFRERLVRRRQGRLLKLTRLFNLGLPLSLLVRLELFLAQRRAVRRVPAHLTPLLAEAAAF